MAITEVLKKIKDYFGLIIISGAFLIAAFIVAYNNFVVPKGIEYVSRAGDTVDLIAESFETTAEKILAANPGLDARKVMPAGTRVTIPSNATGKLTVIRIAHWQLEPGVRDGLNYMAAEYQKLHPNVRVVQNAVPESTYGQWFVTQMVGGTPADLMELGKVAYPLMVSYYMRYFMPLTEYITQPNPYNNNNEFAGIPLRETTKDGLKNSYIPEIQEYMGIGLSQFLVRIYYNKTLLAKLAGYTNAPADWREFMDACEKIRKHKYINRKVKKELALYQEKADRIAARIGALDASQHSGEIARLKQELDAVVDTTNAIMKTVPYYVAVANSAYQMGSIENNMFNVVTSKARDILDFNHDCTVSVTETYLGFKTKKIDLNYGPYKAKFSLVSNFCKNCMPGFVGLNRDDGVLLFVQQRGLFLSTGTWDAGMLDEQAKDNGFEVGVMEFPLPTKDDPEFGQYMEGPAFEDPATGFMFGCPTPENEPARRKAAVDFLLFMSSKENNIKLNTMIGWIPCVQGAEGTGILKYFVPHSEGVSSGLNFGIGGESIIKWQQMYALYQVGQISFDKLRDDFTPFYIDRGYKDYLTMMKNWRRNQIVDEKNLTTLRIKAFAATDTNRRDEYFTKYRYVMLRPLTREVDTSYELSLMKSAQNKDFVIPDAYRFSDYARARRGMR
ncbi:MAG: extracellular solute-binding protein [Spirochaetes bacterium]|nr:extracellular solute-binding protein [Spirochaetota bacterium]